MSRNTDTPKIHHARVLCETLKARGVIVLAFTEDNVAGASYGETKTECGQLKETLDKIMTGCMNGEIPVWEPVIYKWYRDDR